MPGWLPQPEQVKNHFVETLKLLSGRENFRKNITPEDFRYRLRNDLEEQADLLRAKNPNQWKFEINPNWQLKVTDGEERKEAFKSENAIALLGGEVCVEDGEFSRITFNLSLLLKESHRIAEGKCNVPSCCLKDYSDEWRVVRRFVFDFNSGDRDKPNAPTSHLEYGRIFNNDKIFNKGSSHLDPHYCLDRKIVKPRIPFPPMDFVILLDILIDQYENLENIRDEDWDSKVERSEELLWREYNSKISDYLIARDGDRVSNSRILSFLGDPSEF